MDIAAQELNRVRGPFACGVADEAPWGGSDLVTVSQEDRCDGTFGKQCNRRNHGATGSRVRCRGERSGHNTAKRQPDGMRNGAERRHLERTLASGIAAQNKKRRPRNADAFA